MGQGGAQRVGRPVISGEALRRVVAKKTQQEKVTPAEKSTKKAPAEKAKGKRPLLDRSPPPPPTRPRLASSLEKPASNRGASRSADALVEEIPLGGPYVPRWKICEGSSVGTPEVAKELLEHSCLIRDLQHWTA